jgi:cytochrome P450
MGEAAAKMPPNTHPQAYITEIALKYNLKGVFYLDMWPVSFSQVCITDAEVMNQVEVTRSLPKHEMIGQWMSSIIGKDMIVTVDGPIWKKAHNAMAPAFAWSHIRSLVPIMVEEAQIFRNHLDQLSETQDPFSMEQYAAMLLFDITARVIFNTQLHAQSQGSQVLKDIQEMIIFLQAALSFDPVFKLKAFIKRQFTLRRLNKTIEAKVLERLAGLEQEKIVPSRRDAESILDLMLRDYLIRRDDEPFHRADLPKKELDLLVTK